MKNFLLLFSSVACLLLIGCGAQSPYNYHPDEKIITYGKIGEIKTVLLGDSIIHYQVETVADVIEVEQNITGGFVFTNVFIPKGTYVKNGSKGNTEYFDPVSIKGSQVSAGGFRVISLVYNNKNNNLSLDLAGEVLFWSTKEGFKIERGQRLKKSGDDYKMRRLAYAGSHNNLLSFEYREGPNTQRITHNMGNGPLFSYNGSQIEILKYDDRSLTCKIIKEFDIFN